SHVCRLQGRSEEVRPSKCRNLNRKYVWLNTQLIKELDSHKLGQYMEFCCSCMDELPSWLSVPFGKYTTIVAEAVHREDAFKTLLEQLPGFLWEAFQFKQSRGFVCKHKRRYKFIGPWFKKTHEMTCYIKRIKKIEDITNVYALAE
ncbi:unnamed protein product, partial [Cylicocyclus nassatus]